MKKFYFLIAAFIAIIHGNFNAQTCNTVSSFPFKETFEADSPSRSCWTQQVIGGHYPSYDGWVYKKGSAGGVDYNIVNAHSGQLNACSQVAANSPDAKVRLISPIMDVTGLQTPTVSFFMGQEAWGIFQNNLNVYYRVSPTSPWIVLKNFMFNVPEWKQFILDLPEKSSQLQICFEAVMKTGRANVLDDIVVGNNDSVETYPTACAPSTPSNNFETGAGDLNLLYLANDFNVSAHTNLTVTSIILNTIDKGGIESFDIFIMKAGPDGLPLTAEKVYNGIIPNTVTDLNEKEGFTFRKNTFNLPEPVVIVGGAVGSRYWLVVKAVNNVQENPSYVEATTIKNSGKEMYWSGDGSVWKPVTNNADGVFTLIGSCAETDPTDSYCIPRFNFVMPIDNVKIGTINNTSTEEVGYEDFSSIKTDLERGKTYPIQIKAQTYDGTSSQAIAIFVDWNHNGFLGDAGEIYNIGRVSASNSNTITYQLPIPLTASLGDTKVRIISEAFNYATYSCSVFDQGQAEDYIFTIQKESLAVSDTNKEIKTIIFPNPAKHVVTVKNDSKLINAEVFDMNGRKVLETDSKQIDVSNLTAGQYVIKMTFVDGKIDSQKLIKQ
ncbi:T9SS type A sorting domain-containing protein [Epilithonimonas mollis]|uniref:Por secretion system C-terminal sorting domain-containing protein n=1 Tax=Epilithonimonas mollis TaxID=216903 RepID=A0A1M6R270_9FLAO|nr:T9SS type A sorting domain-containing protein [Epilithonimonas mollis]SHK26595.1 Por secretion system C-terminal sorting domain-containing protein [Epilithonimonas mollis]